MSAGPYEQRNPYKGSPARAWARLRLKALDGTLWEIETLIDSGSPSALVIGQADMARLRHRVALDRQSNFGLMRGGWVHLRMPELGVDQPVLGYASDVVVATTQRSSPDFAGPAGLPFLRLVEYGGNADWFWLRPASPSP